MAASKLPSFFCSKPLLFGIIVLQWILLVVFFLSQLNHQRPTDTAETALLHPPAVAAASCASSASSRNEQLNKEPSMDSLPGVGVTVLFRSPQWFHLRTTHMLHNAAINLPPGWGLQLFINPSWFYSDAKVLHWHPGLRRLLYSTSSRIHNPISLMEFFKSSAFERIALARAEILSSWNYPRVSRFYAWRFGCRNSHKNLCYRTQIDSDSL